MAHTKPFEHLKIQLEVIRAATNNFADESCIGRGGFGKVYMGKIAHLDGFAVVAVKRLDRKFGQGDPEFWKEIMLLSLHQHENIVSLIGFCDDCGEKILVYEYLPNKSLDLYLNSDKLTWVGRLKICIGAAQGLAYLHGADWSQQRVLHCDIKSANILLDENWNAKISDFGLSKLGPANQENTFVFTNPAGTHGYCDPLFEENGFLTKESDVYSFGVVLFEVLCGRSCVGMSKQPLVGMVRKSYEQNTINEIVYANIKDEVNQDSLKEFVTIAYRCLKREREDRPLISDVVEALKTALHYQEPTNNVYGGGFLVVKILKGEVLNGNDKLVILRVGNDIQRTTITNNKNPVWNETLKFTLDKPAKAIMHLEVCQSSMWNKVLGEEEISVADLVKEKHMNKMYNIGKGRIYVELKWEPSAFPLETKSRFKHYMTSLWFYYYWNRRKFYITNAIVEAKIERNIKMKESGME